MAPLSEPKFFLRPDESVVAEDRVQRRWILRAVLLMLVFLVAPVTGALGFFWFVEPAAFPSWAWPTWAAVAAALVALVALVSWRRVVTTEYVITDETVYARRGIFLLRLQSAPLDKITDITVHTSLLGRLMGYSTLVVRTAGGAPMFVGLADAYVLREAVEDQRKAFVRRLLKEAGRDADAVRRRERGEVDSRCRCPTCDQAFQVPADRPVDVTCPKCGTEGTLFAEAGA